MSSSWLRSFFFRPVTRPIKNSDRSRRSPLRTQFDALEDRLAPASLTWVGDVNGNWNANSSGNTNWFNTTTATDNALPTSGDTLVFAGAAVGTLTNDTAAGNSYILQFTAGGYTITGNSITLDVTGNDVTSSAGTNAVNVPMTLATDSTFNITAGTVSSNAILGGGSLVKQGAGVLTLTGGNTYSGTTTLGGGTLSVNATAALGNGTATNTLIFSGGTLFATGAVTSPATRGVTITATAIIDTNNQSITISGIITGSGGLTKNNTGTLSLGGNNDFAGITTINRGTVTLTNSNALGATGAGNHTVVNGADGSTATTLNLAPAAGINVPEALTLTATAAGRVTLLNTGQNNILSGAMNVSSTGTLVQFSSAGGAMTVTGDITGTMSGGALLFLRGASTSAANHLQGSLNLTGGDLGKTDAGLWVVGAAAKTYSWVNTIIANGTLRMNLANITPAATLVTLGQNNTVSTAAFELNGFSQAIGGLTFNYAGATNNVGTVSTGAGTLTLNGTITYNTNNSYNGTGGVITGNLNLGGATRSINVLDTTNVATVSELTISAVISNGGISKSGAGRLTLSGASANTFVSDLVVIAGEVFLNKTAGQNAFAGGATVSSGVLSLGAGNQIPDTATITVNGDGRMNFGNQSETIANFTGSGTGGIGDATTIGNGTAGAVVVTGTTSLAMTSNTDFIVNTGGSWTTGGLTITGATNALNKTGGGALAVSGTITYTGATTVNAGTLAINSNLPDNAANPDVTVAAGATLGGSGTVSGTVNALGVISPGPGAATAQFGTGSVTTAASTDLAFEINGLTVGAQYDRLNVTGDISLTGVDLVLGGSHALGAGQQFLILNVTGTRTGTFNGLAEGAAIPFNGDTLFISYVGGDGNDVVLSTPASTIVTGTGGNDTLVVRRQSGGATDSDIEYSLNGAAFVQVNTPALTFDGLAGDDIMTVDFINGDPVPVLDISFTGSAPTTGSGDKLVVNGRGGGFNAAYTPSATVTGNGAIAIGGAGNGTIGFAGLEAVDITGMNAASFVAAASTSVLTLANGLDFATGATAALQLSGTSNAVVFETVSFYNNASVTIDTATNGGTGNDSIAVTSADNGHLNSALTINTGGGTDTVTLNGNINTDGNLTFTAIENIVLGASVTIDTEQLNDNNAGAIVLGGAAISANAVGRDLTINTNVTGGNFNGGAITLGAFSNATGGQFVNDLTINTAPSGAGTAGVITLTTNMTLDENGTADPADFIISNAAKVAIAATLTVNTDNGTNGLPTVASAINWGSSNIYATAAGVALTLSGKNATTTPTPVTNFSIGLVDNNGGAASFLTALSFSGGNSVSNASAVTLNNNVLLNGAFTTTLGAPLFTTSVTIDTAQGTAATGGSITFSNSASPSAAGVNADIVLDTSAVTTGGAISFFNLNPGAAANGLNDVTLNTNGGTTDGIITITGSINLDNNGADTGDFTVLGGGQVRFSGAAHTIDTETGNNGNGGSINFGTSQVSGTGANADLALNTSTTLAGGSGGAVTLASFSNGGGSFINDLAVTVSGGAGGTAGLATLTGNITLDNNADNPDFTITGNGKIAIAATLTIDTETGNNGTSGVVNWGTANVFATAAGVGLTINTDSTGTTGDVSFGLVDNNAGANNFLSSLTIATAGTTASGRINMAANIFVDGNINLSRRPNPLTSIVIDSEQGNNGPAGSITLSGALSSSVAGVDVTLDASVAGAFAGGNVILPETAVDSSHGFYINDLTINTAGGASDGTTTIRCNITLNDNAGDAASFTVLGGGAIRFDTSGGNRSIDTEQGDNGPAGAIDFGSSIASATVAGADISLIASTTGGVAGAVTIGGFDNAGGAFVNDLTLSAVGSTNANYGNVTVNGAVTLATNAADLGDFAITGSVLTINQAVTTTGNITWNARQGTTLASAAVVSAGAGTIAVLANQDGAGAEGLTMGAGASLSTTNETSTALAITVNTGTGTGGASLGSLATGTATGLVTVLAAGGISDANGAAANITAAGTRLVAAGGIGAADALETAITNLAASATGNAIQIANTGNLIVTTVGATSGVVSGGANINLGGGSLTINQPLNAGAGDMRLALTGGVTQAAAGTITADELGIQAGGAVDLNDASPALNNVATLGIVTTSGDIVYRDANTLAFANVAAGGSAGFTGASGIDTNAGNIDVRIALGGGSLTIPAGVTVDSGPGTGGDLTQGSAVIVNGTINLGAGDIFLLGGLAVDIILSASQTFASGGNVNYVSTRDIIVQPGVVIDVQNGGSLSLQSGFDNPAAVGAGGVWVQAGAAVKTSGSGAGTLTVEGKDLWATPNSTPGPNDDSVRIDGAASSRGSLSIGFTNDAVSDPVYPVTAYLNTTAPLAAPLGSVSVNFPARIGAHTTLSAGAGDVSFVSTIDGGFNLAATASGDITVGGAIGAAAPVGDVSLSAGNDVDTFGIATLGGNAISVTNGGGGTINGAVTEAAPATTFTKDGPGSLIFTGAANNYTGLTTVNDGTLHLAKVAGVTSIAGPLTIGDGNTSQPPNVKTAIVRIAASDQIVDSAAINFIGGDGRLFVDVGVVETIPSPVTFGTGDVKIAGQLTTTTAYDQDGGTTTLAGGSLRIGASGTLDGSLAAGVTLQGSGTIFTKILTSNGTIDPSSGLTDADYGNASPGTIFIRGNLQMTGSSATNLDVGTIASDRLNVGINVGLALPAGSYTNLSNYDLDPYLRGDVVAVTEPGRRGVNDLYSINGTVRFNGTLNTRPIQGSTLTNNVTYGNSMNFVWRALNLPVGGFWGDLNPKGGNLSSVPSDFVTKNSLDVNGLPTAAMQFDPRYMGSGGQFNAVGQSVSYVVKFMGNDQAGLTAPAYSVGQAKGLTLTSLTSSATVDTAVKVTKQLWNAMRDSHTRVTLTVTNTSAAAVTGPIYVELVGVPSGATPFNAAGKRPSTGKPYLVVPAASLAAGAAVTMEVDLLTPVTLGKFSTLTVQVLRGGMP